MESGDSKDTGTSPAQTIEVREAGKSDAENALKEERQEEPFPHDAERKDEDDLSSSSSTLTSDCDCEQKEDPSNGQPEPELEPPCEGPSSSTNAKLALGDATSPPSAAAAEGTKKKKLPKIEEFRLKYEKIRVEIFKDLEEIDRYNLINDAKLRAMSNGTTSYEEFQNTWKSAHLRPLEKNDRLEEGGRKKVVWNTVAKEDEKSKEEECPQANADAEEVQ